MPGARRLALLAGAALTAAWLRRRARRRRVPTEHHVAAEAWVAAQIGRLRALTYEELLALLDAPEMYEVPVGDGGFALTGEVQVFWDDPDERRRDLRVMVDVWNQAGGGTLAVDGFIRAPDGSFVDER